MKGDLDVSVFPTLKCPHYSPIKMSPFKIVHCGKNRAVFSKKSYHEPSDVCLWL